MVSFFVILNAMTLSRVVGRVERQRNPTERGRRLGGAAAQPDRTWSWVGWSGSATRQALAGGFVESSLGFAPTRCPQLMHLVILSASEGSIISTRELPHFVQS